jgi:hypothetical protein
MVHFPCAHVSWQLQTPFLLTAVQFTYRWSWKLTNVCHNQNHFASLIEIVWKEEFRTARWKCGLKHTRAHRLQIQGDILNQLFSFSGWTPAFAEVRSQDLSISSLSTTKLTFFGMAFWHFFFMSYFLRYRLHRYSFLKHSLSLQL